MERFMYHRKKLEMGKQSVGLLYRCDDFCKLQGVIMSSDILLVMVTLFSRVVSFFS